MINNEDNMALTKKQRKLVWDKSGGFCWYCGCNIPLESRWHADHVEPVIRESAYRVFGILRCIIKTGEQRRPENDKIENIVPSCAQCNNFKLTFSIEEFRKEIEAQVERGRKSSVNFRTAERFGLIELNNNPKVLFWFEKNLTPTPPSER